MAIKLSAAGEVVGGTHADTAHILYAIAKLLFGADANGIVVIPDSLTAAPTSFATANFVAEVKSKT